ncbi:hypothetical protein [Pseudorhodoplanes sp.]|uniref:hypothetical protein n=1 Tax=Pseudorhodoplanes sp. TaxID=1934341 RepID=UPI002CCEF567|nr:hypothetical protein [Pseudorhodoplanes sp.]HWV54694.1 hypothetical protein [Pseudorhodoplanes sp.]
MRHLLLGVAIAAISFQSATAQDRSAKPPSGHAAADYQKRLKECTAARARHEAVAVPYWTRVGEKRQARNAKRRNGEPVTLADYVLEQPPVYAGPPCPRDPSVRQEDQPEGKPELPVVADFLQSAREHFGFVPELASETDFKRAYARVASAAGITREQAVRIYGFETGGSGKYDAQAGLIFNKPGARAISTALGYNQLLTANTASLLAGKGHHFVKVLQERAAGMSGEERKKLERKIDVLKRMVAFSRTVPEQWGEHVRLARTQKGIGLHALNLDIDIGPLLQTQKLLDSVRFAKAKGIDRTLTAAELEMMNLTGDGNGFDMLSLPPEMRAKVPTSNFFQRLGYERNPIAGRTKTVEKLIAETNAVMDNRIQFDGAKELARVFD